jgi:hypothetical protein
MRRDGSRCQSRGGREDVTPPSIPLATWLLAAFDPILIVVAVVLGWKADQFGKVFIATIAALGLSALLGWLITLIGLPWLVPVSREAPTLFPVRTIAAVLWASAAYGVRRIGR